MSLQLSNQYSQDQIDLLKRTVCKEGSDDDLKLFLHVCNRTQLDPFAKQIYAVFREDKKLNRKIMTIQTGIDGYRLIAERTGKYMPGREPVFSYGKDGNLISATAFVKKFGPDKTWHEVAATAFWSEYVQTGYEGKPLKFWGQMPHGQLGKCAESLALRKAFPSDMSGLYTKEEMEQSESETLPGEIANKSSGEVIQLVGYISAEEAREMEEMIFPGDDEYKQNLLNYFKADSFAKIPREKSKAAWTSIERRAKQKSNEEMANKSIARSEEFKKMSEEQVEF